MELKNNKRNLRIFIIIVVFFVVSLIFNFVFLFKYPIIKYENDENIVFFGDSLTDRYEVDKFFPNNNVINKGVGGNKTEDLLNRIDKDVYDYNPSKVFILIGINDFSAQIDEDDVLFNIRTIVQNIKLNRKNANIYVESIYPISKELEDKEENKKKPNYNNDSIDKMNEKIRKMCKEENITYINVHDSLTNKKGKLKDIYTYDGIHLSNMGYLKVTSVLNKYVKE